MLRKIRVITFIMDIQVVLKIAERCNIDCTYCYYFNGPDQSYKTRPKTISLSTIKKIAQFLQEGVISSKADGVVIGFHGGEPLLLNRDIFDQAVTILKTTIKVPLKLSMQTNGILINQDWINLFKKHFIHIGISLDGIAAYNDEFRVDFKGRGTHKKVVEKLALLQSQADDLLPSPGILSVLNPSFSPRIIFNHFVKELNITSFDLLLPDYHHDKLPPEDIEDYGNFLIELFNVWIEEDNPEIKIRLLNSNLDVFTGGESHIYGIGPQDHISSLPLITIYSDGSVSPTDELKSTDPELVHVGHNVSTHTFKEIIDAPNFRKIISSMMTLPTACLDCCWQNVCGGGGIVNRYSKENDFNNPSVYCHALKKFYSNLVHFLLAHNYPMQKIESILF
jgi:uncharacterized protein